MPDQAPPMTYVYDDTWMLYVLLAVFAAFALAYWVEKFRRSRDWRRTLEAEWAATLDVARDKDFSPQEMTLLEDLIRRFAPTEPFRVVTMRQVFNNCAEKAMDEALQTGDKNLFDRRGAVLRDMRVKLGLDYVPMGLRIQSTRELYTRQPVWIAPSPGQEEHLWTRMLVSNVDEGHFYLEHDDNVPMPAINVGSTVHFRLWREEDARYEFDARLVAGRHAPTEWKLIHTTRLRRLQARAHYRIRHDYPCEVGVVNAPVDNDMTDVAARPVITRLRGRVTSLSGGGYAVVVTQPVPRQVILRILLELEGEAGPVLTNARIVGTVNIPGGRYLLRCSFVGITDEEREMVTRFVFQTQQPAGSERGEE
jgi:c-di-GMP-binding flagellar brake protein YcgR